MTDPAPNEAPTTSGHGHLVGWNVNITPAAIISGGESGDEICAEIRELLAPLAEAAPSLKENCARIYERVAEMEAERDALALSLQQQEEETTRVLAERDEARKMLAIERKRCDDFYSG